MPPPVKSSWTTPKSVEAVRPQVRDLLTAIPALPS